jgi:hypothetical protein
MGFKSSLAAGSYVRYGIRGATDSGVKNSLK